MFTLKKTCFLLMLFFSLPLLNLSAAHAADDFLPPFSARYTVYFKGLVVGKATRQLIQINNNDYRFETRTETAGIVSLFRGDNISEKSLFSVKQGRIQAVEYDYQQVGRKQRHYHVVFDWKTMQASNTVEGEQWTVKISPNTLDNMLYQLAIMQDLASGKTDLQYEVAHKGEVRRYVPSNLGKETVETGMGNLETVKYERISEDGKRRTTLWCAPALRYLPVKIEHFEKGDSGVMVLEGVQGLK